MTFDGIMVCWAGVGLGFVLGYKACLRLKSSARQLAAAINVCSLYDDGYREDGLWDAIGELKESLGLAASNPAPPTIGNNLSKHRQRPPSQYRRKGSN